MNSKREKQCYYNMFICVKIAKTSNRNDFINYYLFDMFHAVHSFIKSIKYIWKHFHKNNGEYRKTFLDFPKMFARYIENSFVKTLFYAVHFHISSTFSLFLLIKQVSGYDRLWLFLQYKGKHLIYSIHFCQKLDITFKCLISLYLII